MKKEIRIAMILFLTVLSVSCTDSKTEKPKKTDIEIYHLKGKVRSVKEVGYDAQEKYGKIQKLDLGSENIKSFNNKGNILVLIGYDNKGALIYKYTYRYDDNQNLIMETSNNALGKSFSKYKYDNKGNKIEMSEFKLDNVLLKKDVYKYDWNGNLSKKIEYGPDKVLENKYIYKYNDKGDKVKELKYDLNGKLESKYIYKYDDKGNKVDALKYDSNGKLEREDSYKYNINGTIIEQVRSFSNGIIDTHKYNWNGVEIFYEYFNAMGNIDRNYIYKYKYDKYGNWVKRVTYYVEQNKYYVMSTTEREIAYY